MKRILAALLLLTLAAPAWRQDFEKGVEAALRGDYATAVKWYRKAAEGLRIFWEKFREDKRKRDHGRFKIFSGTGTSRFRRQLIARKRPSTTTPLISGYRQNQTADPV